MKKIFIRTDASIQLGTGHVMRCLTLADELKQQGSEVTFICRDLEGNLISYIEEMGFKVFRLKYHGKKFDNKEETHIEALATSWEDDAYQTIQILNAVKEVDWLIVDHYSLDIKWELNVRPYTKKIMVIDDLANRKHNCDMLLDQTYGRDSSHYQNLVPIDCIILNGTKYVLIKSDFIKNRIEIEYKNIEEHKVHVFFGGADYNNYTIRYSKLLLDNFQDLKLLIIVGKLYKYVDELIELKNKYNQRIEWRMDVSNMAESMSMCTIAIGSPGITTWERICVGLPSAYLSINSTQNKILEDLEKDGMAVFFGSAELIENGYFINSFRNFIRDYKKLNKLHNNNKVIDGMGIMRVLDYLLK